MDEEQKVIPGVPYDLFTGAFLSKITEYEFSGMTDFERTATVDGYMKRAIAAFKKICQYDLTTTADDNVREFAVEIEDEDLDEIVDIVCLPPGQPGEYSEHQGFLHLLPR